MWYFVWVPVVILIYIWSGFTSYKLNATDHKKAWFFLNWAISIIPSWPFVASISKSLVFDGILYDALMVGVYTVSILYFTGSFKTFNVYNYTGIVMVIAGLFIFKQGA